MALTDNILAYYKLDNDGSGAVSLVDSTSNGNTLTNNNNVALGAGKINGCSVFNGSNNLAGFSLSPTNNLTFSAWFKSASVGQEGAWFGMGTGYPSGFRLLSIGGDIIYQAPDSATASTTDGAFNDENWHHVVGTADGTNVRLYVDGVLVATIYNSSLPSENRDFQIGSGGDFYANCSIDEVGIWSRALSATEVGDLYNSGVGNPYSFGLAYFNAAVNGSLTTLGNWWQDYSFTTPATSLPNGTNSVLISANVTSGTGSYASAQINNASIASGVSITANTITLNGTSSNAGTLIGATSLNNTASNSGTITGNATIYYPSANPIGGTVSGTKTYIWPNGTGLWGGEVWIDGSVSFIIPQPSDVRSGVEYGPAEDPYVGTFAGGGFRQTMLPRLLKLPFPIKL